MKVYFKKKQVGFIQGHLLIKMGKQVHLFEKYDGFGISKEVIDKYDIRKIRVHHGGIRYEANLDDFKGHGIYYDNDGDLQWILPRRFWKVGNQQAMRLR